MRFLFLGIAKEKAASQPLAMGTEQNLKMGNIVKYSINYWRVSHQIPGHHYTILVTHCKWSFSMRVIKP